MKNKANISLREGGGLSDRFYEGNNLEEKMIEDNDNCAQNIPVELQIHLTLGL
jgi:hypothetical protein